LGRFEDDAERVIGLPWVDTGREGEVTSWRRGHALLLRPVFWRLASPSSRLPQLHRPARATDLVKRAKVATPVTTVAGTEVRQAMAGEIPVPSPGPGRADTTTVRSPANTLIILARVLGKQGPRSLANITPGTEKVPASRPSLIRRAAAATTAAVAGAAAVAAVMAAAASDSLRVCPGPAAGRAIRAVNHPPTYQVAVAFPWDCRRYRPNPWSLQEP
jgi:hypothetical protein